jgi:hypothetical protein
MPFEEAADAAQVVAHIGFVRLCYRAIDLQAVGGIDLVAQMVGHMAAVGDGIGAEGVVALVLAAHNG